MLTLCWLFLFCDFVFQNILYGQGQHNILVVHPDRLLSASRCYFFVRLDYIRGVVPLVFLYCARTLSAIVQLEYLEALQNCIIQFLISFPSQCNALSSQWGLTGFFFQITCSLVSRILEFICEQKVCSTGSRHEKKRKKGGACNNRDVCLGIIPGGGNVVAFVGSLLDVLLLKKDMGNRSVGLVMLSSYYLFMIIAAV